MRILLISQVPPYFESYRNKNLNFPIFQAQAFWVKALEQLGHKVAVFRYSDSVMLPNKLVTKVSEWSFVRFPKVYAKYNLVKNRHYGLFMDNWIRSIRLKKLVKNDKFDLVIISGGISHLTGVAIKAIKKQGIPLVLIHGVNPTIGATTFEKNEIGLFDLIVTNDPSHVRLWENLGARKVVSLPMSAVDVSFYKKLKLSKIDKKKYESDVVFVGTLTRERQSLLKGLVGRKFNLKIYGLIPPDLGIDSELKGVYCGEAWGNEAVKIYNAGKIGLNLVDESMSTGGNMRTFEIPACGVLELVNRVSDKWYEDKKEVVIFNGVKELVKKIEYYLAHDEMRERIALAGYRKTLKEHTYIKRFETFLKMVDR